MKISNYLFRNQSVVVNLSNSGEQVTTEQHAHAKLGKRVFVGWPFLWEARVVSMADEFFEYTLENGQVIKSPHTQRSEVRFFKQSESLERLYSKRYGVIIGAVEVIVQCNLLCGKLTDCHGIFLKLFTFLRDGNSGRLFTQQRMGDARIGIPFSASSRGSKI